MRRCRICVHLQKKLRMPFVTPAVRLYTWVFVLVPVLCTAKGLILPDECPIIYRRHSVDDISAGAIPYLWGGVYKKSHCPNCQREARWASFCGGRPTGIARDNVQYCQKATTEAVISQALLMDDSGPLTMTPCDLWRQLRGRTTWIIG